MKLSQRELEKIVKKCKRRDRLSQRKIYYLFYVKMMSVCYRYARDEDEAKDILQDGFIKVFEKIRLNGVDFLNPEVEKPLTPIFEPNRSYFLW